jgi:hypothetical protein
MYKLLTLAMLLLVAPLNAQQFDPDDLIARHLEAVGGIERLRDLKSILFVGKTYTRSMPLDVKLVIVPPDRAHNELTVDGVVFMSGGTNGSEAWQKTPLGTFSLSGDLEESARQQADIFPLLDYDQSAIETAYLGEALVKGKPAHRIRTVSAANDTVEYYLVSGTSYLLTQESSLGA